MPAPPTVFFQARTSSEVFNMFGNGRLARGVIGPSIGAAVPKLASRRPAARKESLAIVCNVKLKWLAEILAQ